MLNSSTKTTDLWNILQDYASLNALKATVTSLSVNIYFVQLEIEQNLTPL